MFFKWIKLKRSSYAFVPQTPEDLFSLLSFYSFTILPNKIISTCISINGLSINLKFDEIMIFHKVFTTLIWHTTFKYVTYINTIEHYITDNRFCLSFNAINLESVVADTGT